MFLMIFGTQFYSNLQSRSEPPSKEWSKEVLLTQGNIGCNPKLVKFKENYVVAYGEGENIKILNVDSIGRKIGEKSLPIKEGTLKEIHLFTDDKDLYMVSEMINKDMRSIVCLKGNSNFEFNEVETIPEVMDVVQIDQYAMAISLKDKIEFVDFKQNKKSYMNISKQRFLSGSKNKDEYVLCYLKDYGEFDYVTVKNGVISEPKLAGNMSEFTRITYKRATMIINDNIANVIVEYDYRSEFSDTKILTFSLNSNKSDTGDFKFNGSQMKISNIEQFSKGAENSILVTSLREYAGKKEYEDILKLDTKNGKFVKATPLSRSREISKCGYGSEDTVIFCDVMGIDNLKLYMVSSREEFKKANNNIRKNEVKLAIVDTFESMIYSAGYIIIYGMFWILPSLLIAGVFTILEYRLNTKLRHYAFIFTCIIAALLKWYFVNKIFFVQYRMMLPKFMSPLIGLCICTLICLTYYIPAYLKYKKDEGSRVIAVHFSVALIIESFFTVMFFGSFLV
jgi:hypothetical protein